MREIKFRQPRYDLKGKFFDWFYWGFVNRGFIAPIRHDLPNYQYTGLKDKQGKEIYEGDILIESTPDEYYILGIVNYNQTADCVYAGQFYLSNKEGYASDFDGTEAMNWHIYEVAGNIYENPDLLKE